MPRLSLNGAAVNYTEAGAGDPVVLLHAGGSSGAQWRGVVDRLGDSWRLLMPDFYGHGKSDSWTAPERLSHDDQARLVAAVIQDAGAGPAHLVGHSYGGASAVRLILGEMAPVRSLVLIEPMLAPLLRQAGEEALFAEYLNLAEGFLRFAERGDDAGAWRFFIDYRNGTGAWEALAAKAREGFLRRTDAVAKAFRSNLDNPTTLADCGTLGLSTTIVCGDRTTAPDRRVTEILREHVPDAHYVLIEGAEHMSPLTHADAVADVIRNHLARAAKS